MQHLRTVSEFMNILKNEGFISDEEIDCYIDEQPAHGKESNKPEESIASDGCNVS